MQTSVFSSSQALAIRDPSAPSALISDPHTRSPLIRGSSSAAGPGRILNGLYDRLGGTLEKRANRVAHRAGLGPAAITEKIRSYFGENEHRYLRLTELRSKASPFIEKDCVRLVGYALPNEAISTQLISFKCIVELSTSFPGMRSLFHRALVVHGLPQSQDKILVFWNRSDGCIVPSCDFHRNFAAACLFDDDVAPILEGRPMGAIFADSPGPDGLTTVERLLVAYDCRQRSPFASALSIRYLSGILQLSTFWLGRGRSHDDIVKKICSKMVVILQDCGVHSAGVEKTAEDCVCEDHEGVDGLADSIFSGLLTWSRPRVFEEVRRRPWYKGFVQFVELLRNPDVERLFPRAWNRVKGGDLGSLLPAIYPYVEISPAASNERPKLSVLASFVDFASASHPVLLIAREWRATLAAVKVRRRADPVNARPAANDWGAATTPENLHENGEQDRHSHIIPANLTKPLTPGQYFDHLPPIDARNPLQPVGARVFYWNGQAKSVYGIIQTTWRTPAGIIATEIRHDGGRCIILPASHLAVVARYQPRITDPDPDWIGRGVSWTHKVATKGCQEPKINAIAPEIGEDSNVHADTDTTTISMTLCGEVESTSRYEADKILEVILDELKDGNPALCGCHRKACALRSALVNLPRRMFIPQNEATLTPE
ncbi:hypothetical protein B0H13DRAFT_2033978 [Mycena leptocephala]|nr:hypothetical protein B0H13DRAFT_2033978 [Mycena leptocephala]